MFVIIDYYYTILTVGLLLAISEQSCNRANFSVSSHNGNKETKAIAWSWIGSLVTS